MSKNTSNQALEARIKEAFTHATPNHPSSALSACEEFTQKGRILPMNTKKKSLIFRVAAVAAAFVLCCGVAIGLFAYESGNNPADSVAATVSLDVNPSIEIALNDADTVLSVTPLNEDAKVVIGEMDLKGCDLDVTVNAIIGSMVKNGYINELANSVLLSVNGADTEKSNALREALATKINDAMQSESVDGSVLSQTVAAIDEELKALAQDNGISVGKAQLLRQFIAQNSTYTFEELVELTINELNLLSESGSTKLENVELTGKVASDKKYMGKDAVREAVLDHAGVPEDILSKFDCEMDFMDGRMVYDVKFDGDGFEHDYMIDAESGEIIRQSKKPPHGEHRDEEREDRFEVVTDENGEAVTDEQGEAVTVVVAPETRPEMRPEDGREPMEACTETHITPEEALAKALEHAELAADAAIEDDECELGRKRGACVYEVEFDFEGYEYEYLIGASTGDVVKYQKEPVRDRDDHREDDSMPHHGEMESRPERPEDDEEMTRPERPEDDEEMTRPERPEHDEEMTRPERPEDDEDEDEEMTRPERPEHDEEMTRPERPEDDEDEDEEMTRPERPEHDEDADEEMTRPARPEHDDDADEEMPRPEMGGGQDHTRFPAEAESDEAHKGFAPLK